MLILSRIKSSYQNFRTYYLARNILKNRNISFNHRLSVDDAYIIKEIFFDRIYAHQFPFYQKCTVLDIGAHKGFFSLFAHLNLNPASKIICLEPSEKNFQELKRNIEMNNMENVIPVKKGISANRGNETLHLINEKNNSLIDNYSSLLTTSSSGVEEIEVVSISDIINEYKLEHLDFLKMDCEGAEYEAIFGCDSNTLSKITTLSIEFHDLKDEKFNSHQLVSFLQKNNFSVIRYEFLKTMTNLNIGQIVATRIH